MSHSYLHSFISEALDEGVVHCLLALHVGQVDPTSPFLLPNFKSNLIIGIEIKDRGIVDAEISS